MSLLIIFFCQHAVSLFLRPELSEKQKTPPGFVSVTSEVATLRVSTQQNSK